MAESAVRNETEVLEVGCNRPNLFVPAHKLQHCASGNQPNKTKQSWVYSKEFINFYMEVNP